ncbi:MAG: hypothetical protein M3179_11150 [Actinomycetota bacterium]|nr:hypothetical protein [Actinomycetota bacterium]
MATFSDARQARKAIENLGRAGIEAEEMSAGSRSLKDAGSDPDTRDRDVATTGALGGSAIAGAAIGLVIGAVVGAVAMAIAGLGPKSPGFWIALIGGAIAGGAVGGMIGGVRKLPLTEEWELTYDEEAAEPDGTFRVAVHAADAQNMEKARKVLESEHPQDLKRLNS